MLSVQGSSSISICAEEGNEKILIEEPNVDRVHSIALLEPVDNNSASKRENYFVYFTTYDGISSTIKMFNHDTAKLYIEGMRHYVPKEVLVETCSRIIGMAIEDEKFFYTLNEEGHIKRYEIDENKIIKQNSVTFFELTLNSENRLRDLLKI